NRIVMAPMTRNFSPDGVPGADVADYYRRRAENGVGLIVTEGTVIDHAASTDSTRVPRFFGERSLAGWRRVVEAVHAVGGRIMPQIWHVGMRRAPGTGPHPGARSVGPSGINAAGEQTSVPLSLEEIEAIVDAYGRAAGEAERLGFDGVEIHGAHGYLIDQFFWSFTNHRADVYGGDLAARTRFGADVVRACRRAVSPDFPIVLRFSQWKGNHYDAKLVTTPDELAQFLAPLADAGVDVFHCSTRRFWEPEFAASHLTLAGWTKKLTGRPTIAVGSVGLTGDFISWFAGAPTATRGIEDLLRRLEAGEFDLVAIGRALIADPAWAIKVREGRAEQITAFTRDLLQTLA
ncbi:MAG TPA: NADH:flavin oxidoreductase, partial [Vicinamibacterales bacterium]|nr:NADH:flavin oxidoreductase [Vicinamibacterales bacterium]